MINTIQNILVASCVLLISSGVLWLTMFVGSITSLVYLRTDSVALAIGCGFGTVVGMVVILFIILFFAEVIVPLFRK